MIPKLFLIWTIVVTLLTGFQEYKLYKLQSNINDLINLAQADSKLEILQGKIDGKLSERIDILEKEFSADHIIWHDIPADELDITPGNEDISDLYISTE